MELFNHVSELLYDHNCVIVPGFGGFVANFKAAEYNTESGTVKPARKMVAFNQNLIENDGLLIQHVSKKLNISYNEAESRIIEMVQYIWERLDQYRNFEFRSVGTIYLNKENKLVFVPYENHNFYTNSYGLPGIKVKPIRSLNIERKKAAAKPQLEKRKPALPASANSTSSLTWRVSGIAATFLLFLGAAYLGIQFSDNTTIDQNKIVLNESRDTEALGSIMPLATEGESAASNEENTSEPVSPSEADISLTESEVTTVNVPQKGEVEYHIIVLKTTSQQEAESFSQKEILKIFDAELLPKPDSDEWLVSVERFSTRKIAEKYLELIRSNNFNQAFILELP